MQEPRSLDFGAPKGHRRAATGDVIGCFSQTSSTSSAQGGEGTHHQESDDTARLRDTHTSEGVSVAPVVSYTRSNM
ncbi:unnamed protein product [Vitrella brassicaformis CCMP3155]|uniref:Uncharacterized protein n=1 Tax=Vitrella brassicaformis (strain CCMP3155) TaxID=1169540 RepID=A0A0G4G5N4_VITBC|nr:unnamed protein product [Vitrella brassicaformis CCMP3155]|eukprot:CEM23373.1 unnamed protein product [Vitrella brassicaformis CCMP3155]